MLYCVVSRTAPSRVARTFEALHADDGVRVVFERRRSERRAGWPRRAISAATEDDRRQVHGFDGRRVGDRRAMLVDVSAPALPRGLRRYAECVRYAERVAPRDRDVADVEIARLVLRVQAGDSVCFEEIYRQAFSDVYGYFHVVLGEHDEAEDATQQVFVSALSALPRF